MYISKDSLWIQYDSTLLVLLIPVYIRKMHLYSRDGLGLPDYVLENPNFGSCFPFWARALSKGEPGLKASWRVIFFFISPNFWLGFFLGLRWPSRNYEKSSKMTKIKILRYEENPFYVWLPISRVRFWASETNTNLCFFVNRKSLLQHSG